VVDAAPVKGDKVARALAVQANFANGMIYAPDRVWSELVITEMEVFPKGRYDDLTDSTTKAIRYLRDNGLMARPPTCPLRSRRRSWVAANRVRPQQSDACGPKRSSRAFNPQVNLTAECHKVDRLGQQRFSAVLLRLTFGLRIAVGRDHDDRDVRACSLRLGQ
jgi:hypothetical protein